MKSTNLPPDLTLAYLMNDLNIKTPLKTSLMKYTWYFNFRKKVLLAMIKRFYFIGSYLLGELRN
jgi:hypothetical protein